MKKSIYVLVAAALALSTAACESTDEKLCKKTHECSVMVCENLPIGQSACNSLADDALETCLKEADKNEKNQKDDADCQACYDAGDAYSRCVIDHTTCDKDKGVSIDTDACKSKQDKMVEKCTKDC